MDPAVAYANCMSSASDGRALWVPESSVEIGDVGFIEISTGRFTRPMNVTRSADDPLNAGGVPDDFERLVLNETAEFTRSHLNRGSMRSTSVKESRKYRFLSIVADWFGAGTLSAKLRFRCSENAGALLFLRDDADKSLYLSTKEFTVYMSRWYASWCTYAEKRGYSIGDLDLLGPILVRGWVKTSSWGVAAWSTRSQHHDARLHGEIGGKFRAGVSRATSKKMSKGLQYRHGPKDRTISRLFSRRKRDQCIFISYFQAQKRPFLPPKIVACG